MDKRMTILVVSCDKYKDIADQYMYYLRLNWPDCPFPVAIATEECDYEDQDVWTIKCGYGVPWTKEVLMALNQIESDIVLMTVDDLFISRKVDNSELVRALDFLLENELDYYRIPKGQRKAKSEDLFPGQKYVSRIRKNVVYSVTIGSSIWRKSELKKILGDGTKTAWELEDQFSEMAVTTKDTGYFEKYVTDTRPLLQCAHMVTAGKWIPQGIKDMEKQGFHIDTSTRGMLSLKQARRMELYGVATRIVPKGFRKPMKSFLSKFGMKFATKY